MLENSGDLDPSLLRATDGDDRDGDCEPPTEGPYTLRPARPDDLMPVRDLLVRCSLPSDGLEDQFGRQFAVGVSSASEQIIGVAGYEIHEPYALVRSVAVDPAWQDRGVGSDLLRDRLEAASEVHGIEAIFALTTTADDFFRRFGFVPIDRSEVPEELQASREFSEVCPASATVLCRAMPARRTTGHDERSSPA